MTSAPLDTVDFDEFHKRVLPGLVERNGPLALPDVREAGALAIRLAESGSSYTYLASGDTISIVEGDADARTVVELDRESFGGLAGDLDTVPGLLYRGKITAVRGNVRRLLRWEAPLRSLYHGIPMFDPATAALPDLDGKPLDPELTFTLGDDPAAMAHFLHTMGYLVVKQVFTPTEVGAMLEAAERLRAAATEGDKASWWGRNASGEAILTRVLNAGTEPVLASLYDDERLQGLADLSEFELVPRSRGSERGVTVLWKHPEMTEGLADIPWHRDCGMGGHAVMCPLLVSTVCLTDGSAAAGELRVLPGSWRGAVNFMDPSDPGAPQGTALATTAGDVSFHYSDSMHASLPPNGSGPFRVSALVAFVPPEARPHRAGERTYNDPLLSRADGQVEHLDRVIDRL